MEKKLTLENLRKHIRNIINEEFENFYQGMDPEKAIQKAEIDYNYAMKNNNESKGNKILGNLKSHLENLNYNWMANPKSAELLGDF